MLKVTKEFILNHNRIAVVGRGAVGNAVVKSLKDLQSTGTLIQFDQYNSTNIDEIFEVSKSYDLLIYAGVRAFKGAADSDPEADKLHILKSADTFIKIKANKKILISTIDAALDDDQITAYGQNRRLLEEIVLARDPQCQVLRLPALFGSTVTKNAWHDMVIGPENVTLMPDLQEKLEQDSKKDASKEFNILSMVSDDSRFLWFNLDTIVDAISDLHESKVIKRLYVSYSKSRPNGMLLGHRELKDLMRYHNIGQSHAAKRIDYTKCLDDQQVSFVKSEEDLDDPIWRKVVQ